MSKYLAVSGLLRRRIKHGDYVLTSFPTDRELAAEFKVDNRTVRRAVGRLIEEGLLSRQPNGRPAICRNGKARMPRIAFLNVAYPTPYAERWHAAIEKVALRRDMSVRVVGYSHLDDPVIRDVIDVFDGIFFGTPPVELPADWLAGVRETGKPVVFLDIDVSQAGLPCLWLASPIYIRRLFDHLRGLGHRRIEVLNTQPHGEVIVARLNQCRLWLAAHADELSPADRTSRVVDEPVEPNTSAMRGAYEVTRRRLASGGFDATGIVCTTSAAAKGAIRAFHESGLVVGRDVSVCAADDGAGEADLMVPSLTSLRDPDPTPYLSVCMDWIASGGSDWVGPLLVQPHDVPLLEGESTGPCSGELDSPIGRQT